MKQIKNEQREKKSELVGVRVKKKRMSKINISLF
jgi:hypothetical protein